MSNLIAIAYPDVDTAMTVRDRLAQMQKENLITLEDAAVVERKQDGRIKLHQATSMAGRGAAGGALWGGLIGMLFFMPLLGMALGAAGGAAGGALTDAGVDDDFMRELATKLEPGTAALFLLVVRSTPDKVIPQIAEHGGHIIQTSLSREEEEQLRATAKAVKAGA
ncbi:DUF1269 domain-containing protein [Nonomuraea sp. MG754425]|uniref:DUF1269 domain-containing protein n=1 Tax=Nonomuraea sp. MG754425 TaxID=2570319 RepID=UPI001F34C5CF|nr:DUF1269 domain-containing protein [Nonomuraea sp. MG754425]MCF6467809.1 DUF1269 domain-containing protein [Nonomuraea sp. MG754425]